MRSWLNERALLSPPISSNLFCLCSCGNSFSKKVPRWVPCFTLIIERLRYYISNRYENMLLIGPLVSFMPFLASARYFRDFRICFYELLTCSSWFDSYYSIYVYVIIWLLFMTWVYLVLLILTSWLYGLTSLDFALSTLCLSNCCLGPFMSLLRALSFFLPKLVFLPLDL